MVKNSRQPIGRIKNFTYVNKKTVENKKKNQTRKYFNRKSSFFQKIVKYCEFYQKKYSFLWLFFRLFTLSIVAIALYGIYLDQRIRSRIDGQVWQLPAAVYGRMISLKPEMPVSKNELIKLLEMTQYRKVIKIHHPGEFSVKKNSIELIRRPFCFPDQKEEKIHVRLTFCNNQIKSIKNLTTHCQFNVFRLDPPLITILSSSKGEQRFFLGRKDFTDMFINILLSVEDHNFYDHDGISLYSICRAILANIIAGKKVQGGSTLTQQLVKNLFLTNERSYWRKINEAYMAILMDYRYSKDRILELYMNEVYLGQNGDNEIRGFPLASLFYFSHPIGELSLEKQALLVGMVKGASIYNPWRNPKITLERRNLILRLLQQKKIINRNLYNKLSILPLGVQPRKDIISPQPAFMQILRQELEEKLGDKIYNLSGIKIFTTFDIISQNAAEKATIEGIPILKKRQNLQDLEAAMVVIDKHSGEIRAIIGGVESKYAGYNRAIQARRSIGSLAKPATYLTALSQPNTYRLNTWIADAPLSLRQPNGQIWSPKNENRQFSGQVMLVDALTFSINVPTVNLSMSIGLSEIADTWQKLGVPRDRIHPFPAMVLGALNLTPIEVAQAFQTIANLGNRAFLSTLHSVISEDGKILYQNNLETESVVPAQATYILLRAMQQVILHGTGRHLGKKYPDLHLAGKTGTTNNNVDTWFVGIDNREVVITWVGRDNNQPTQLYGSNGAMIIYQRYLSYQFPLPLQLTPPKDVIEMKIDDTGNFICQKEKSEKYRLLPVWTVDPYSLCNTYQFNQNQIIKIPISNPAKSSQEHKNRINNNPIIRWIKKMFKNRQ